MFETDLGKVFPQRMHTCGININFVGKYNFKSTLTEYGFVYGGKFSTGNQVFHKQILWMIYIVTCNENIWMKTKSNFSARFIIKLESHWKFSDNSYIIWQVVFHWSFISTFERSIINCTTEFAVTSKTKIKKTSYKIQELSLNRYANSL